MGQPYYRKNGKVDWHFTAKNETATTGDDYRRHHRGRSLQALLRNVYRMTEEKKADERLRGIVHDIIHALAKLPSEPGHACWTDCPCHKEKVCRKS